MNLLTILPWKTVARRWTRRHGFVDPIELFDRMRRFAQPSEVGEPIELLRAGAAFHARGLVNRTVQFNLDWVWPYWIEKQFNPADDSFVPRAFSFSHINLTHRNWTAVGLPDIDQYPIVDPRGLVTPLFDGWSIDFSIVGTDGKPILLPSKTSQCEQNLRVGGELVVDTRVRAGAATLATSVWMEINDDDTPTCVIRASAEAPAGAAILAAVRPYNPEGISFIDSIAALRNGQEFQVNGRDMLLFSREPRRTAMSCYTLGDVLSALSETSRRDAIQCSAGMATGAALFDASGPVEARVPLARKQNGARRRASPSWRDETEGLAKLEIPEPLWQSLYDAAVSTVLLHAPHEVYPGPYTYKRFWYRDAALILNSLACIGAHDRCRGALDIFPRGQLSDGYFRSQEGEWDSNGEVLWILHRAFSLSGQRFPAEWLDMVERGARWIVGKRMPAGSPHPGLLPAGFSAEHLGLNDYYYWDDIWGVAGLRSAALILRNSRPAAADEFTRVADEFQKTIEASIERSPAFQQFQAVAAAPDRRMDSGAVGSLVADFPVQLFAPGDRRISNAVEWLLAHSFVRGGFFQNMIHSGINAYLTLHVAQVLLRAGDKRALELVSAVADLASPTGQWPEAIHPRTLGGCMGDGQHVWAAAEWIVMMRNLFVREEGDTLVIGSGIPDRWLTAVENGNDSFRRLRFGPGATAHGPVTVTISAEKSEVCVAVEGAWRGNPPVVRVELPGYRVKVHAGSTYRLSRA